MPAEKNPEEVLLERGKVALSPMVPAAGLEDGFSILVDLLSNLLTQQCGGASTPEALADKLRKPSLLTQSIVRTQGRKAALQRGINGNIGIAAASALLKVGMESTQTEAVAFAQYAKSELPQSFDIF
jgi:hypothetical protein